LTPEQEAYDRQLLESQLSTPCSKCVGKMIVDPEDKNYLVCNKKGDTFELRDDTWAARFEERAARLAKAALDKITDPDLL